MKQKLVPIGNGFLAITSEDFLNGFQAGHLAFQLDSRAAHVHLSDRHLTSLLMEKLESTDTTELYNFGYVTGWFATLANQGVQIIPNQEMQS